MAPARLRGENVVGADTQSSSESRLVRAWQPTLRRLSALQTVSRAVWSEAVEAALRLFLTGRHYLALFPGIFVSTARQASTGQEESIGRLGTSTRGCGPLGDEAEELTTQFRADKADEEEGSIVPELAIHTALPGPYYRSIVVSRQARDD